MNEHPQFVPVPRPAQAPVDGVAATLGLCDGLKAECTNHQYRCAACSRMQPAGAWQVWVPDSVRRGDPAWSVTEAARQNAFNGSHSAWCLACALALSSQAKPLQSHSSPGSRTRRLLRFLRQLALPPEDK